jgi:hypothetical protein
MNISPLSTITLTGVPIMSTYPHDLPYYYSFRKYCITPIVYNNTDGMLTQEQYVTKQKKRRAPTKRLLRKASEEGDTQILC